MPLSEAARNALIELDDQIGRNWFKHARAAGAADDLLRVIIADGVFTTKIDGWIHAATLTSKSIIAFDAEPNSALDLEDATSWSAGNSALRWGRWQTDFHWKIDTRLWQYMFYLKFMRDAYRDAIEAYQPLDEADRRELLRVITEFYDQGELALIYRWEVLERSRGFARHPDPTAGASTHGYTYEVTLPLPDLVFDQLPFEFIGGGPGRAAPDGRKQPPPPFPRVTDRTAPGLPEVAKRWLKEAQASGLADSTLCVRLGKRMVPTRFNGWEEALRLALTSLTPYCQQHAVDVSTLPAAPAEVGDLDLTSYPVRLGLVQAEFQRRLRGAAPELIELFRTQQRALAAFAERAHDFSELAAIDPAALARFYELATGTIGQVFERGLVLEGDWLPELQGLRPFHPRFAPFDPVEPLPWERADPEQYRRRMERLGYVI